MVVGPAVVAYVGADDGRSRRTTERFRLVGGAPEPESAVAGEAGAAARGVAAAAAAAGGGLDLET